MRKIMFRGKRTEDGVWVEGDLCTEYIKGNVYIVQSAAEDDRLHLDLKTGSLIDSDQITIWHEVDPETVSQMIGVRDVNGDNIYENHIVVFLDGEFSFRAMVQWAHTGFYLKGIEPKDNFNFDDFVDIDNATDLMIVGNVFDENKALLEGDE